MEVVLLCFGRTRGIKILKSCNNFIDSEVVNDTLARWHYTGFYGYPERARRADSWRMIRSLSEASALPWCIIGDFNDLMSMDEKEGGRIHPCALLEGFSNIIM